MDVKMEVDKQKGYSEAERMDAQSTEGNSTRFFSPYVDCELGDKPDHEVSLGVRKTSNQMTSLKMAPENTTSTSPSINLSELNNELSQLNLKANNLGEQKISHHLGNLQLSTHNRTSMASNSKELSKEERYRRASFLFDKLFYRVNPHYGRDDCNDSDASLVHALVKWAKTYQKRYIAQKIARTILRYYYASDFKLVIPSRYKLESFPFFSRCEFHFFQLQQQSIKGFVPSLPHGLSILDLGHNQLNNDGNIYGILFHCARLDKLILHHNCLSNIAVAPRGHPLTYLDVSNNKISPVTFKDGNLLTYSSLLFLFLDNNDFRYIPQCPRNLRVLDVSNINLHDKNVSALKELYLLENLNLSKNFLTVVPEIGSLNIKCLNLGFNHIKNENDDLSLDKFHQLESVNMEHNQLTTFPPMHCNVKEILFAGNQITTDASILRLNGLSNLTILDLSNNNLTSFPFSNSKKLQYIYLSYNKINQYDRTVSLFTMYLDLRMIAISANPIGQNITELKLLFPPHVSWIY